MERRTRILLTTYMLLVFVPLIILLTVGVIFWNISLPDAVILATGILALLSVGVVAQIRLKGKDPSPTSKQIMIRFVLAPILAAVLSVISMSLKMPTVVSATIFFGVLIAAHVQYHFR